MYLNPDVLMRHTQGIWLCSNPRLRFHVELDLIALQSLAEGANGLELSAWSKSLVLAVGRDYTERDVGVNGLHVDHSGVSKTPSQLVQGDEFLSLLLKRRILISEQNEGYELLRPLSSVLDSQSVGSFHQRVGQYLFKSRQTEHWRSWQDQKFSADGLHLKAGAYSDIQAPFFEAYFSKERMQGKRVLDFGCGNGYFSVRMAEAGAEVLALDSSPELLALANKNYETYNHIRFMKTTTFQEVVKLLDSFSARSFDYVYLQDTLLLLLRPESGDRSPDLLSLFQAFRRILKLDGRLCAMEPNAIFWLASRYGDPSHPYSIVSEYHNPLFNVVPRLDEIVEFMASSGFALYEYAHPRKVGAESSAYEDFPIWDFFTFGMYV